LRLGRLPFFVTLLLLAVAAACQPQTPEFAKVGQTAPSISLPLADGGTAGLSDQRGKVVLVNFWATWCVPCRSEMPALQHLANDLGSERFSLLLVDLQEDSASVNSYRHDLGITLPVLLDAEGNVTRTYGVRALPATFLIDSKGTLVRQRLGPLAEKSDQEWSPDWLANEIRALIPK